MSKKKIYFMGLLANTDSSILKVNLDHGFKIETISENEGVNLVSTLEGLPRIEIGEKLFMEFPCLNSSERKFYFISNSFESIDESGIEMLNAVAEFENKFLHGYLDPTIRLMRLFKEGNICMPLIYYYFIDNSIPRAFTVRGTHLYISPEPEYTLEDSEVSELDKFIRNTKLPFTESFLQLAFETFELSYQTHDMNLSFLSLMISLEILFHPSGQGELNYRISRNAAVLLGKNKKDSKEIKGKVKELYSKRSAIVHAGKSNSMNKEDLLKLRHYVRESIKEINKIGKSKNELLDLLDLLQNNILRKNEVLLFQSSLPVHQHFK